MGKREPCPVAEMARVLGRKWVLQIIHHLREPRGFRELQQRLGNINPTLLSERLKFLEQEGIVHREVYPQRPPRTIYSLTRKGEELLPLLDALATWARRWQQEGEPASPSTSTLP